MADQDYYSLFERPVSSLTGPQIETELARLGVDPDSPARLASHPLHQTAVDRMLDLRRRKNEISPPDPGPSVEEAIAQGRQNWRNEKLAPVWREASKNLSVGQYKQAEKIFHDWVDGRTNEVAAARAIQQAGLQGDEKFMEAMGRGRQMEDAGLLMTPSEQIQQAKAEGGSDEE